MKRDRAIPFGRTSKIRYGADTLADWKDLI